MEACIECGKRFEYGEIITALVRDTGCNVNYWYCSKCFDRWWFWPGPVPVERDDKIQLVMVKGNKVMLCPKVICPADYMKSGRWNPGAPGLAIGRD